MPSKKSKKIIPDQEAKQPSFVETHPEAEPINDEECGELAVDVFQQPSEIVIVAPIAGVKPQNLSIEITDGVLTLSGRRAFAFSVEESDYVTRECFWGAFKRSIILPEYIDETAIRANFTNGILTIRVPKTEPVRTRTVIVEE